MSRITVNDVDETGTFPLFIACYEGNEKMVDFLIERGAEIKKVGPKNATLLHAAAERDFVSIAKKILAIDKELVFEVDEDGNTALHVAI